MLKSARENINLSAVPEFISVACSLAESSAQLSMVTDTSMLRLPYVSAMIIRAEDGTVSKAVANMNGRGLQIGRENVPFLLHEFDTSIRKSGIPRFSLTALMGP